MSTKIQVKKGARQKLKAALGLASASGSGKTVSALFLAYGMMSKMFPDLSEAERWEKVGVLDTEHSRSLLYINTDHAGFPIGEFMHVDLVAPFSVGRYKEGVDALKEAGCEVIIVDSGSHVWSKEGGILEAKAEFEKQQGKNSYTAWQDVIPLEAMLHETLFMNSVHMITTLRTKQEYTMEMNDKGKMSPVKLGMKPIQRDDMEYEFMTVLSLSMDHIASSNKDNTGLFEGRSIKITPEHGEQLYDWLEQGIDVRKIEREKAAAAKAERDAKLNEITSLVSQYPEIKAVIEDIELKMKSKVDKFGDNALNKAHGVAVMKKQEIDAAKPVEVEETPLTPAQIKAEKARKDKADKEAKANTKEAELVTS